jgi:hypothetical protein
MFKAKLRQVRSIRASGVGFGANRGQKFNQALGDGCDSLSIEPSKDRSGTLKREVRCSAAS